MRHIPFSEVSMAALGQDGASGLEFDAPGELRSGTPVLCDADVVRCHSVHRRFATDVCPENLLRFCTGMSLRIVIEILR